ncbi:Gfo/Idh/MocA family protein [Phytohabitans kaempferiae]|uniref:Gfo/Idh/MocA family protein n=1 Tax=Phytohabitans kaempferiae TaxID=1620943 RepID=A0ABV6MIF8_9ACTN
MPALRFAVVGCGVIGRVHAAAIASLAPHARFVLAVDEDLRHAEALAQRYDVKATDSVADALNRDDIDAVAVCTPSGTHADLAIVAMRSGKHAVVEKPLDVTVDAARRVAAVQRQTGRTLTVISQHRFDPASQAVHEAIRGGRLGRLTSGVASVAWWRDQSYYDSAGWRGTWALDGGGAVMNQGIHTIDLLLWMLGTPVELFAYVDLLAHERIEVEDTAAAAIRFASGALGTIHCTTAAHPGLTARLQIHGDRGSAAIDNNELSYLYLNGNQPGPPSLDPTPARSTAADPAALEAAAHAAQYRDFVAAVRDRREPLVTVADSIRSVGVISAIYQSARTRQPVDLQGLPFA